MCSGTNVSISDPSGEIQDRSVNELDELAAVEALRVLEKMSEHANWFSWIQFEEKEKLLDKYRHLLSDYKIAVELFGILKSSSFLQDKIAEFIKLKNQGIGSNRIKEILTEEYAQIGLSEEFVTKWVMFGDFYDNLFKSNSVDCELIEV